MFFLDAISFHLTAVIPGQVDMVGLQTAETSSGSKAGRVPALM
jgi:hypothetical protein